MHFWANGSEIVACVIAYILAFFLPGYLLAKWLRSPTAVLAAFVLSVMILCQGFFWLEVVGVPLRFGNVLVWESAWTLIGAWCFWRKSRAIPGSQRGDPSRGGYGAIGWMLIGLTVVTGGILLLRAWLAPLTGPDVGNRWGLLARQVLRLGHYHFYPPRRVEDYRYYGFPESLPPMLTAALWWIYASLGRAAPKATAVFVVLQYAALAGFVYRLARRFTSPMAAAFAVSLLAATPLVFFSLVIGQEAGLVAIGAVAMVYFILAAEDSTDWRSAMLAGAAAAFGPLVREYALVFPLLGLGLAIGYRRPMRWIIIFCATAAALALPWYGRTWILTGNPVYSLSFFGLCPVNPIIAAQYAIAARSRSAWIIPASTWWVILRLLLELAPLQLIFGLPALIGSIRRRASFVVAFLVFFSLWFVSFGLSDSLLVWARILLPAIAILSVLMAIRATPLMRRSIVIRMIGLSLLCIAWMLSAVFGLIYPRALDDTPPSQWLSAALSTGHRQWDQAVLDANIPAHLPAGCRILSTDLYAYSALLDSNNPVVPLWSPEAAFIFDPSINLQDVYRRLRALHICAVWFNPQDLYRYPANPLYRQGRKTWKLLVRSGPGELYRLPSPSNSSGNDERK